VKSIGVLQARPAQSKHLETAAFDILGRSIDVSNLRTERFCLPSTVAQVMKPPYVCVYVCVYVYGCRYAADSRIPLIEAGTPSEDAKRRDLTVNALFYNINTDQIEDFNAQGLDDLAAGVLRTPLPPTETFLDDPLRVLRVARFGARFPFTVDPAIAPAGRTPALQAMLVHKVSRERIGQELMKMLRPGSDVTRGLALLCEFGLYPSIFHVSPATWPLLEYVPASHVAAIQTSVDLGNPATTAAVSGNGECAPPTTTTVAANAAMPPPFDAAWYAAAEPLACACVTQLSAALDGGVLGDLAVTDRAALFLAGMLAPMRAYRHLHLREHAALLPVWLCREGLSLSAQHGHGVGALVAGAREFSLVTQRMAQQGLAPAQLPAADKLRAALVLHAMGPRWRHALVYAGALASTAPEETRALAELGVWLGDGATGLDGCWARRPHVDGRALMSLLGLRGIEIGLAMRHQTHWMLLHPHAPPAACAAELDRCRDLFRLP
jgi:hypothetical protein